MRNFKLIGGLFLVISLLVRCNGRDENISKGKESQNLNVEARAPVFANPSGDKCISIPDSIGTMNSYQRWYMKLQDTTLIPCLDIKADSRTVSIPLIRPDLRVNAHTRNFLPFVLHDLISESDAYDHVIQFLSAQVIDEKTNLLVYLSPTDEKKRPFSNRFNQVLNGFVRAYLAFLNSAENKGKVSSISFRILRMR